MIFATIDFCLLSAKLRVGMKSLMEIVMSATYDPDWVPQTFIVTRANSSVLDDFSKLPAPCQGVTLRDMPPWQPKRGEPYPARKVYVIEIRTLKDLYVFVNEHIEVIIGKPQVYTDGLYTMMIYDDRIE